MEAKRQPSRGGHLFSVAEFFSFPKEIAVGQIGVGVAQFSERVPDKFIPRRIRYATFRAPRIERCAHIIENMVGKYGKELFAHGFVGRKFERTRKSFQIRSEHRRDGDLFVFDLLGLPLAVDGNDKIPFDARGRILVRAQSTVFDYFIKMRQRYTAIYGG